MTAPTNGQVQPAMQIPETVAKNLAMQIAQVTLDKAFVEARFGVLIEHVQAVLQTMEWVEGDNGVLSPVVAAAPMQALQSLVLSQG